MSDTVEPTARDGGCRPSRTATACAAAVVLLPGPQRGGQPRGPRRGGARDAARRSPRRSRSSPSTTARGTRTPGHRRRARRRPSRTSSASSTTRSTSGYGAALRSGFARRPLRPRRLHRRRPPVQGRRHRPADRAAGRAATPPTSSSASGSSAPTRSIRTAYARAYRLANRIFFGLRVTDVDCACKLFRREALEGLRVESGGAFFSAELLIKLQARRADRRRGRRARTTRGRRARRPAPSRRSSSARSATSGGCACACG